MMRPHRGCKVSRVQAGGELPEQKEKKFSSNQDAYLCQQNQQIVNKPPRLSKIPRWDGKQQGTEMQMVALPPDLTGRHLETGGQFRDSVPGPQAPQLNHWQVLLNSAVDSRVGNPDNPSSSQRGGATSAKTQRVLIMSPDHDFAEGVQHLN
ncbi:hypothetical protein Bbelb_109630 [Branchiostoma belcheri]|nr:hypothetical protein Bbelb_109630 [Branchiostoma belcheri]